MNIGIDIDDTLTDSFDYFMPFVAEYFHVTIHELKSRNISYGNFPEEWKKDELDFCRTYYDRVAANTPFKPDAAWAVQKLRELGHRIIIITARTAAFYTDPYQTTKKELSNGHIVYDKLLCTLDKAEACLQENISLLIDDSPTNCFAVNKEGVSALLFTSKANQAVTTTLKRVSDWKEVVAIISTIEQ